MLQRHFYWLPVYISATKNIQEEYNYFYAVIISITLAIFIEIFIQIDCFFWELCKKTKVTVFFLAGIIIGWQQVACDWNRASGG